MAEIFNNWVSWYKRERNMLIKLYKDSGMNESRIKELIKQKLGEDYY